MALFVASHGFVFGSAAMGSGAAGKASGKPLSSLGLVKGDNKKPRPLERAAGRQENST